jgi:hypothetical protein
MGNPVPAPNPVGMGMGKKSPQLLNGDGDEMALPGGEQTRCHPYSTPSGGRARPACSSDNSRWLIMHAWFNVSIHAHHLVLLASGCTIFY